MIGDLHCHSKLSDGSTGLDDIVFYAKRAGLDALAITDHDTMSGVPRAEILGRRYGLTVIPGVEISTFDPNTGRRVHILCYLPHKSDALAGLLERTLEERRRSGERMIENVSHYYPVTREHVLRYSAASNSIYKVHIMQALLDLGYDTAIYGPLYQQLFSDHGGSCIEKTAYPQLEEVLQAVRQARGVAVFAHPSVYQSMELVRQLAPSGLIDGIEVYHPRNRPEDQQELLELCRQHNLIVTGGTDFHGSYASRKANPLGTCVTDAANLKKLFARAKELAGGR